MMGYGGNIRKKYNYRTAILRFRGDVIARGPAPITVTS